MARPLAAASAAWTVAILAAVAGVLLPSGYLRLSLAFFAFAVALGVVVAVVLVADGLRGRRRRGRAVGQAPPAQSPLTRLEYLPAVTTGTRRIRWHGGRYRVHAVPIRGTATRAQPLPVPAAVQRPTLAAPDADLTAPASRAS